VGSARRLMAFTFVVTFLPRDGDGVRVDVVWIP
jgi:hypothetical protein